MKLLEVRELVGGYGDTAILKDLTLHVGQGEIVVLIGPNGAGKSTAMKAIFGLIGIQSGTISYRGTDITRCPPEKMAAMGLAYVPQERNVFPHMSVKENLELGAYLSRKKIKDGIERAFDFFPPLKDKAQSLAGTLSGGQRQMVAIARALMLEPGLLLLDEPTAGLSPLFMQEILKHVQKIHARGMSILMVEQNAKQALAIAHRAYILVNGKEKHEGAAQAILDDPRLGQIFLGG